MQASNLALLRRLLKGQKRSDGLLEDERNNQNQNRENHPGVSEHHSNQRLGMTRGRLDGAVLGPCQGEVPENDGGRGQHQAEDAEGDRIENPGDQGDGTEQG